MSAPDADRLTAASNMRLFVLERREDESGVSGNGVVAEGCEFTGGACVMTWLVGPTRSVGVYPNVKALEQVHGHDGKTLVRWLVSARAGRKETGRPSARVVGVPS